MIFGVSRRSKQETKDNTMTITTDFNIGEELFALYKSKIVRVRVREIEAVVTNESPHPIIRVNVATYAKGSSSPGYHTFLQKDLFRDKPSAAAKWLEEQEVNPRDALRCYMETKDTE
jgi:hypothetical protein